MTTQDGEGRAMGERTRRRHQALTGWYVRDVCRERDYHHDANFHAAVWSAAYIVLALCDATHIGGRS